MTKDTAGVIDPEGPVDGSALGVGAAAPGANLFDGSGQFADASRAEALAGRRGWLPTRLRRASLRAWACGARRSAARSAVRGTRQPPLRDIHDLAPRRPAARPQLEAAEHERTNATSSISQHSEQGSQHARGTLPRVVKAAWDRMFQMRMVTWTPNKAISATQKAILESRARLPNERTSTASAGSDAAARKYVRKGPENGEHHDQHQFATSPPAPARHTGTLSIHRGSKRKAHRIVKSYLRPK